MRPDTHHAAQHLRPPSYKHDCDNLQWRKDVRSWARTDRAWRREETRRPRGCLLHWECHYLGFYPHRNSRSLKRPLKPVKLILDPFDLAYPEDKLGVIEPIVELVAKDSATDGIKQLERPNKLASSRTRISNESASEYIERFFEPAQAYLNLTSADRTPVESQNLAMTMLINASLSLDTFSSVRANLVSATKTNKKKRKKSQSH